MPADRSGRLHLAVSALLALGAGACAADDAGPSVDRASRASDTDPRAGADGLGDRIYPQLGNGGYRVDHYDLSFDYEPATQTFAARTVIDARATGALRTFDLDFTGNTVLGASVNDEPAAFQRTGDELVITPGRPLRPGGFRVAIDYAGAPTPHLEPDGCNADNQCDVKGWFPTPDGFFLAPQPDAARTVFPCNDHPSDKATITFHVTVPVGVTVATSGALAGKVTERGRTRWTFQESAPIATELVQIAVGDYSVLTRHPPGGPVIRDVIPTDMASSEGVQRALAPEPDQIAWLASLLGPYPFAIYGTLGGNSNITFAEETQTLAVWNASWLRDGFPPELEIPDWVLPAGFVHEEAHQWFGDSVSPSAWTDLWLDEGHATFYQYLYAADHGGPAFEDAAHGWYLGDPQLRSTSGPPAAPRSAATLFSDSVYTGGALALFALRQQVGLVRFGEIERAWLSTFRDRHGSTQDFIDLAVAQRGPALRPFLQAWLYGATTPAVPGHPEWIAGPARAAPAPSSARRVMIR